MTEGVRIKVENPTNFEYNDKRDDIVEYYNEKTHELRWLIKKDGSRVLQEKIVKRYGYHQIEAEWIDIQEEIEK